ncbi:hypothetical protein [Kitasatospora purpeofusca]|uniref:hypothetical protein n=1 Tax=Kitasatospora purpeofusca TaxID=67352 RepID=UPI003682324A
MSEQQTPTPAEAIPGGVTNPATPAGTDAESGRGTSEAPKTSEAPATPEPPKPVEPDYKALYEKMTADLEAATERGQEAGVEADELRAQVSLLQEQALRDRVASEYALPPALAKLVQGGDEAAVRAHAAELAAIAAPKPLHGAGGLTPDAPKAFNPDELAASLLSPGGF